ncbi:uncharacterized protein [Parasteatoda tepidariorum]|uniref:uncharacterized protein n=1 Tax=Parasteatoda tepidariorum TaxID=114398 RepID=UPI001C7230E3|nr:uncharacterized protein LOC107456209 [Parasteatoda tepidariorum]
MAFDTRQYFAYLMIFCFVTYLIISWYISKEHRINVNYKSDATEYNTFIINQEEEHQMSTKEIPLVSGKDTLEDRDFTNNIFGNINADSPAEDSKIQSDLPSWRKIFSKEAMNNQIKSVSWNDYPYEDTKLTMKLAVKPTKNPAFIIDTSTCRIPKFDPWDSTVRNIIHLYDPFICPGPPLFMTAEPYGSIYLNLSVLEKHYNYTFEDANCWYWPVVRQYEPDQIREDTIILTDSKRLYFYFALDEDHIAVKCYFKNNFTYQQYFPLVRLKDEVENKKSGIKPTAPLNVILLGIDSVSKLNFLRHFRQTKAFLEENMKAFDMKGYTKVADNTFLNIVPMLTGHFVEYYWNETVRDTFFFDNISLIWKDYAKQGYRTFFADDAPFNGIFNYFKRGFFREPTDYYYRPTALMIEQSEVRHAAKQYNSTCINSQLETDLMYDYLINFVKTMGGRPYFAFCMVSILTHDVADYASYADAPAARLLKGLDETGALNNSVLVIFSDHGIRYGKIRETYIGKFEERMPFMYIHFPKWFLAQNSDINRNMIVNQERLMTLFDIHATLKHLLNPKNEYVADFDEYGLSLLNEIPESRTCDDAAILHHWCPCNEFEQLEVNNPGVINASQAIVKHINMLLQPHADVCETLELAKVMDARQGLPNEHVLKYQGHVNEIINMHIVLGDAPPTLGDYLITLEVKPGGAILEGTVRYDAENAVLRVLDVSRINMYGTQSWCIDSAKLKLYCFCKVQIE